jgi:prepilin-type N-terminal cleavage/methylation domain-containing protein
MLRFRRGFTLVEMLVVISIIGLLITLTVPAVMKGRENANRAKCANNLHQIMVAMQAYEAKYRTLPPGRVGCDCSDSSPCRGKPAHTRAGTSGFALILPELDEMAIYERFRGFSKGGVFPGDWAAPYKSEKGADGKSQTIWAASSCDDATVSGWNSSTVMTAMAARPAVFICPSDRTSSGGGVEVSSKGVSSPKPRTSAYAMSMGSSAKVTFSPSSAPQYSYSNYPINDIKYKNNGPFIYVMPRTSSAVTDGLANTVFLGEVTATTTNGMSNRWAVGWRYSDSLRSLHNGIANERYNTYETNGKKSSISAASLSGDTEMTTTSAGYFNSRHLRGAFFAFGDGHVTFLRRETEHQVLMAISTMNLGPNEGDFLRAPTDY